MALSGAQLGKHPIHPMLVVLPLGLWVAALAFDMVYALTGNPAWRTAAFWDNGAGIIGALLAAVPGVVDWLGMTGRVGRLATYHMLLNLGAVAIFAVNWFVRTRWSTSSASASRRKSTGAQRSGAPVVLVLRCEAEMTPPTPPVPAPVEKWISRSRYLRWVDAATAWLVLLGVAVTVLPAQSDRTIALLSVALLVLGVMLRPLRVHWRPVSGWAGVLVSRTVRPGDRAWFVRDGRADSVLVTARRGLRLSIAVPGLGETETMSVRRTRVFLVPA